MNIYPSIASSNCLEYGQELKKLGEHENLHLDIEDGNFTPNITFGLKTAKAICGATKAKNIQVHLMANDPVRYLNNLKDFGVTEVFAHIEALDYPMVFINTCHNLGMRAGLALNIRTGLESIKPFYSQIDSILFMTSEPDGMTENLYMPAFERAVKAIKEVPSNIKLLADGGLTDECVQRLKSEGFYGVVLGRLVFKSDDVQKVLKKYM